MAIFKEREQRYRQSCSERPLEIPAADEVWLLSPAELAAGQFAEASATNPLLRTGAGATAARTPGGRRLRALYGQEMRRQRERIVPSDEATIRHRTRAQSRSTARSNSAAPNRKQEIAARHKSAKREPALIDVRAARAKSPMQIRAASSPRKGAAEIFDKFLVLDARLAGPTNPQCGGVAGRGSRPKGKPSRPDEAARAALEQTEGRAAQVARGLKFETVSKTARWSSSAQVPNPPDPVDS